MTINVGLNNAVNSQWLAFLKQQNAQIENNRVVHFGDIDTERQASVTKTVLCELGHLGFISAEGEEAQSFLQNQLSNDVNQVSAHHSQLNAYCTAKGRAIALLRLFKLKNRYVIQLPVERIEPIQKRLQMFILRSKVTLQNASEQLVAFGIAGPDARRLLSTIQHELPEQDNQCTASDQLLFCKIQGTLPRYMIIGEVQAVIDAWTKLSPETVACNHNVWSYLDILAGVPQVYEPNVEAFVPQMINLHSIDGISFSKGCYPGQEIVARMHYLGKLKRRMYLTHIDDQHSAPHAGDLIFAEGDQSKEGIGRVVDAQPNPNGGYDFLSVLQIASVEAGPTHLHSTDGPILEVRDLPYTVVLERKDA